MQTRNLTEELDMSMRDSRGGHPHRIASSPAPPAVVSDDRLEWATGIFLKERSRLLRIAQRIVGDHAGAEDVVQDAWVRWQRVDQRTILNPGAFLMTATTHLAINVVQSARHRHEHPTDSLRGNPLGRGGELALEAEAVNADATERMLGFLMARMTAAELAAYVLRKSFAYTYPDIAELLGISVDSARQLVRRGQLSLTGTRDRPVDPGVRRRIAKAFSAASEGEFAGLERLLVDGVTGCWGQQRSASRGAGGRAPGQRASRQSRRVANGVDVRPS